MYDWNYSTCTGAWVFNKITREVIASGLTKKEARNLVRKLN